MILVNGCSMSQGAELANPTASRWSTRLGQRLNQPVANISQGGVSNATIARTTVEYLLQTANPITHVIIGWTNCDRAELGLATGDWLNLTPQGWFAGDDSLKGNPPQDYHERLHHDWYQWHHNAYTAVTETIRHIVTVTAFCQAHEIQITNFFAMPDAVYRVTTDAVELERVASQWYRCFPREDLEHRDPDIEAQARLNLQAMIQALPRHTWFLWGNNLVHECRDFPHGARLHPLEAAQEHFAELLYDHIRQR